MTHLRKTMLEELERRNFSQNTTRTYVRIVEDFANHGLVAIEYEKEGDVDADVNDSRESFRRHRKPAVENTPSKSVTRPEVA